MEIKKLIHFYFDWNVFKYIENPRNEQDVYFSNFIFSLKNYILIAYSPIHLSGLLKNFDKTKLHFIIKDCKLITSITNNLCIFYDQNNQIHLEYRDPLEMFFDQLETESQLESILDPIVLYHDMMSEEQRNKFDADFNKVKSKTEINLANDPFSLIIRNSESPEEAFCKITIYNIKMKNDPETYINLRSSITEAIKNIHELPESGKEQLAKVLQEKGIDKNIEDLDVDDLLNLSKDFIQQNYNMTIVGNYTIKDLLGKTKPEKISLKNTFKNIIDDSLHLEMAKYSLYYISEDKANIEKSKLTSKDFEFISEIYTIEEANKIIRVSLVSIKKD